MSSEEAVDKIPGIAAPEVEQFETDGGAVVEEKPAAAAAVKKSTPAKKLVAVEDTLPEVVTLDMRRLVYQAPMKRSETVRIVQSVLVEVGHPEASTDPAGWLSDGTVTALREFQKVSGLPVTGEADTDTLTRLFAASHKYALA